MRWGIVVALGVIWAGQAQAGAPPINAGAVSSAGRLIPGATPVEIEFLATLSSLGSHPGDMFPIRLAQPITSHGQVLVPAGALGLGEVVEAKPAGGSGTPGILLLAARYLEFGGHQIPLRSLRQNGVGRDRVGEAARNAGASLATVLPGTALAMATHGGNLVVAKGGHAMAQVAQDVPMGEGAAAALPRARAQAQGEEASDEAGEEASSGIGESLPGNAALSVPAPPPGYGQVVFYRAGSLNWRAIGCTVKEEGRKISSLGSGRWFAFVARPGLHAFRVTGETSDMLRMNVEPGETQYVSCRMRASILIARPFIRPEPSRDFHAALAALRPVDDDDMGANGPEGQVLRQGELRRALAERGDVRGNLSYADRAVVDAGFIDSADAATRRLIRRGAGKVVKEATGER